MADEQSEPPAEKQAKPPAQRKRRELGSARLPWLRLHWPSVLLTLLGLTMLGLGVFVEDSDAAAVALVLLGPFIVVVGVLLELFASRLLELALSQSAVRVKLAPPPSADELEQAGLPEGVAEALERWLDDVTRLLPATIEQQVRETLDERERHQRRMRELYERFVQQQHERGQSAEYGREQ